MRPSCDQVLHTPELLELILLHLPMRDLLLAQRTCQKFRNLIRTSPTLQQILYLKPLPESATPTSTSPTPNLSSYGTAEPVTESWQRNPLLISPFLPWFNRTRCKIKFDLTTLDVFENSALAKPNLRSIFLTPEASWRQMLVVQPPVTRLDLIRIQSNLNGDVVEDSRLWLEQGLTMGILYDITCQEVLGTTAHKSLFRLQWHGEERRLALVLQHNHWETITWESKVEYSIRCFFKSICEIKNIGWRKRLPDGR